MKITLPKKLPSIFCENKFQFFAHWHWFELVVCNPKVCLSMICRIFAVVWDPTHNLCLRYSGIHFTGVDDTVVWQVQIPKWLSKKRMYVRNREKFFKGVDTHNSPRIALFHWTVSEFAWLRFMFCGPTGVGKTALCKTLSKTFFGTEAEIVLLRIDSAKAFCVWTNQDTMIRLDMSEFMEKHTVPCRF